MMDIIITAKIVPGMDSYAIEQPRHRPLCPYCDTPLNFDEVDERGVPSTEIWECPRCDEQFDFCCGDYGYDEIAVTEQEWYDRQAQDWQEYWLMLRYGYRPASIRDYWLSNKASRQVDKWGREAKS